MPSHEIQSSVMKHFLISAAFLISCISASTQTYQTRDGIITISGKYRGASLIAESRQLHMNLNYDRGEITMHVSIPLLITENDSLNTILAKMAGSELSFHGVLNNVRSLTKPHQKIKQPITGTVSINNVSRPFKYLAQIEHFPSGNINCVLTGNFILNLLDFGIPVLPGEKKVAISFKELLLKRVQDR